MNTRFLSGNLNGMECVMYYIVKYMKCYVDYILNIHIWKDVKPSWSSRSVHASLLFDRRADTVRVYTFKHWPVDVVQKWVENLCVLLCVVKRLSKRWQDSSYDQCCYLFHILVSYS
jgi:hypothetical protein